MDPFWVDPPRALGCLSLLKLLWDSLVCRNIAIGGIYRCPTGPKETRLKARAYSKAWSGRQDLVPPRGDRGSSRFGGYQQATVCWISSTYPKGPSTQIQDINSKPSLRICLYILGHVGSFGALGIGLVACFEVALGF